MARPVFIRFDLEPNDDDEITCLFCGLRKCEQMIEARGGGRVSFIGIHNDCADKHMERMANRRDVNDVVTVNGGSKKD